MSRSKLLALALLAAVSFVSPLVETIVTGRVETFSAFGLAETLVSLVLLFAWYHLDKREHNYVASRLMNAGILAVAAIALPIYLLRSRGWKHGAIAIGIAGLFLGATFVLGELGEKLGAVIMLRG